MDSNIVAASISWPGNSSECNALHKKKYVTVHPQN